MSCCGKNRQTFYTEPSGYSPQFPGGNTVSHVNPRPTHVLFQYTGRTGMLVIGAVTGVHYRFEVPGVIVPVDIRDRASLATVPNLREIM